MEIQTPVSYKCINEREWSTSHCGKSPVELNTIRKGPICNMIEHAMKFLSPTRKPKDI